MDDLWSLFYSLIELMEGTLPWTDITDADEVAEIKNNIEFDKLARWSFYFPKSLWRRFKV